jgi:hypothetical protein
MNLEYKNLLPQGFSDNSRVWIYQSSRILTLSEALIVEKILDDFISEWKSHGNPVKGFATLFFGQFIVIVADEEQTGVSGCSTDSSVRLIKSIELQFNINLFDRTSLAFVLKDRIEILPMGQIEYAIENGFIKRDTLFIDNSVQTLNSFQNEWIKPVKDSWLSRRFPVF